MKKLLTVLLALAGFAAAQTPTATFTAPAQAIKCFTHLSGLNSIDYYDVVEKSTPPYPGGIPYPNGTFHMPPLPNSQPLPIQYCGVLPGFVSPDQLVTANIQQGGGNGIIRTSAGQAIMYTNAVWTFPADYPTINTPFPASMTATITAVCGVECDSTATGTITVSGDFAFHWVVTKAGPSCKVGCTDIEKEFDNVGPVVLVVNDQSTVAILD